MLYYYGIKAHLWAIQRTGNVFVIKFEASEVVLSALIKLLYVFSLT